MKKWLLLFIFLSGCHRKQVAIIHNVDIRIAFGYKDTRPTRFVGDRYERLYIVQDLLRPCLQTKNMICGFSRDEQDGDSLHRIFVLTKIESLDVRVKITPSSVGPDDELNRRNPYQNLQSLIAENNLMTGLGSAKAVFYVGHSRDGGGPDFAPPIIAANKEVDYRWYQENKPGIKKVLLAIGSSQMKEHQVFGMMSCLSSKHFEKSIKVLTKRVSFVSTHKLIYYTEALNQTLTEVSKLMNEQLTTELSAATSRTSTPKTFGF